MSSESFSESIVWITGSSSGIGRELAYAFARRGAHLAISARRTDRLEEVAARARDLGSRALVVECDVRQEDGLRSAVERIVAEFGRLDVAVANAGFGVAGRVEELTADDWQRQFETNVSGAALTARYALPELRKTRGRLVLVGSVAGFLPSPKNVAYCASKAALRVVGQSLAMEYAHSGVSVSLLHPGYVASEIAQVDNQGRFDPNRQDRRPQRLMWPTDRAAEVMVRAIHRRKREYVFTGHGKVGAFVGKHFPGVVHVATTRGARP